MFRLAFVVSCGYVAVLCLALPCLALPSFTSLGFACCLPFLCRFFLLRSLTFFPLLSLLCIWLAFLAFSPHCLCRVGRGRVSTPPTDHDLDNRFSQCMIYRSFWTDTSLIFTIQLMLPDGSRTHNPHDISTVRIPLVGSLTYRTCTKYHSCRLGCSYVGVLDRDLPDLTDLRRTVFLQSSLKQYV